MLWCEELVTEHMIVPVLFSRGQYLQSFLLQKLNPRSLFELPSGVLLVLGWVAGGVGVVNVVWLLVLVESGLILMKKSVIDFCLLAMGPVALVGSTGSSICSPVCCGSASMSPGLVGRFAWTRRSLRFFGLLYPHTSFLVWRNSVVGLLPSISQFLWMVSLSSWSWGW